MRERFKFKQGLIGSSDYTRVKSARIVRESNHKAFLATHDKVQVSANMEVISDTKVSVNHKPKYREIVLWGSVTLKVTNEEYEQYCKGF
jgi:hypothetical protein